VKHLEYVQHVPTSSVKQLPVVPPPVAVDPEVVADPPPPVDPDRVTVGPQPLGAARAAATPDMARAASKRERRLDVAFMIQETPKKPSLSRPRPDGGHCS
jgi:hypothetical protein